ncbi:class I SAM-dependent methyltransferase [Rhodococcus sp. AG1013]|uniref:class I SAM-dependent methyltransferase n=1 Tax=unclassified Rhodococcus (in: high G+C Gram-positive bacteria) TaxID=192944 RepID=UPI000E0B3027|nr:class I SAM-dependent methyltransferase [Rhodococcus sp. AG1013]RDI16963.1 trans-aconitate 2-methyltransferase [Rhodococcus sp. AG1013]
MPDWDGEQYAQASELQRTMATRALDGLDLDPHGRVLDVGCGDGFVTRMLADRLTDGYAIGVDASPRMIEKAASGETDPRVRFMVADARRLPFRDRFDVVVSFNALHWVPEQQQALASIADAARPGARVLIQVVCAGDRVSLETIAMEVAGTPRWVDRFAAFTPPFVHVEPDDYPELAASAGLRVTDLSVHDVTWDFGTREAFAQWCTTGADAWTHRLDPDDRPRFIDDWMRAYEEVSGRPGLFQYMQMRAALTPSARPAGS